MKDGIKHVFFDLDHTLWDFDRNSALAFKRVFHNHDISLSITEFVQVYEPINFGYWKMYREERITKQELRRGRFREAFSAFGMQFDTQQIDMLAFSYIEELPKDNHLFDGTIDLLEYLSGRYTLHIITNGFEEVQHLKLRNSRIDHFFETVTTSEEAGVKKPHPAIFELAMEKAGALATESVMVGDTFEADIEGAHRKGMQTIFYNHRGEDCPGTFLQVSHLYDLKSIL